MPSFVDYVLNRRVTDTPNGGFVADAKSDHRFREARISSSAELQSWLRSRRPAIHADVIAAAKGVWRQYVLAERRRLNHLSPEQRMLLVLAMT